MMTATYRMDHAANSDLSSTGAKGSNDSNDNNDNHDTKDNDDNNKPKENIYQKVVKSCQDRAGGDVGCNRYQFVPPEPK